MAMSRDAFLQLMISELESMKDSDGELHREKEETVDDVLAKLQFDFPVLEDRHLSQLTEFIVSLKSPQSHIPFHLSERFLDNITYISTSPSYGESTRVSSLCESVYITLPAYLLSYDKRNLGVLLNGNSMDDMEWHDALHRVKTLILTGSASVLGSRGSSNSSCPNLRKESIDGIIRTVTFVLQNVTDPSSRQPTAKRSDSSETLQDFMHRSIHTSLFTESEGSEGAQQDLATPLSCSLDIVGHLLFLVRDMSSIAPCVGLAAAPALLDAIMPALSASTTSPLARQKEAAASTLLHTQMLMFFFCSQLAGGCVEGLARVRTDGKSSRSTDDALWGEHVVLFTHDLFVNLRDLCVMRLYIYMLCSAVCCY
jgi:hypothetical protein